MARFKLFDCVHTGRAVNSSPAISRDFPHTRQRARALISKSRREGCGAVASSAARHTGYPHGGRHAWHVERDGDFSVNLKPH
jgi:hypothetical protein